MRKRDKKKKATFQEVLVTPQAVGVAEPLKVMGANRKERRL